MLLYDSYGEIKILIQDRSHVSLGGVQSNPEKTSTLNGYRVKFYSSVVSNSMRVHGEGSKPAPSTTFRVGGKCLKM